jgi:hypothetical protein
MKQSVTQELDYGCGVACFAFVTNMTFQQAIVFLGREYSVANGWRPTDIVAALNNFGYRYKNNYVRRKQLNSYTNGTIVLLERSIDYPVGHYLVMHNQLWMDPWINMPQNNNLFYAESGFRKELPGKVMYALIPQS